MSRMYQDEEGWMAECGVTGQRFLLGNVLRLHQERVKVVSIQLLASVPRLVTESNKHASRRGMYGGCHMCVIS